MCKGRIVSFHSPEPTYQVHYPGEESENLLVVEWRSAVYSVGSELLNLPHSRPLPRKYLL